jgi:hypothetical protein
MDARNCSFLLREGAVLVLPEGFEVAQSRNAGEFPETPMVMTVWRGKDDSVCQFARKKDAHEGRLCMVKVFMPKGMKAGDSLQLSRIYYDKCEKKCACAVSAHAAQS